MPTWILFLQPDALFLIVRSVEARPVMAVLEEYPKPQRIRVSVAVGVTEGAV
jgi:hypothetical protein